MSEFLAFVDEIGRGLDGGFLYRLDFTEDTEVVWGDFFNVVPAIIIPNLQPDINCLSSQAKISSPVRLNVASKTPCFSMQDCIDGIISLCFSDIDEEKQLKLDFGMPMEDVEDYLKKNGIELFDKVKVEKGDESEIDNLIDRLGENGEE